MKQHMLAVVLSVASAHDRSDTMIALVAESGSAFIVLFI
jgi:hypothetical protein